MAIVKRSNSKKTKTKGLKKIAKTSKKSSSKTQSAVENERENFSNLFMQTPDMLCILSGPEHVFEFVNEAHVKVLGFNATGMSVHTAHPGTTETNKILDEVYRSGKTAQIFETPVMLSGHTRYFTGTYAARRDRSGQISGVMALAAEVTEQVLARKKIEEHARELELSQKESTDILESTTDGFIALDKNYTILRVNKNQERISGLGRDKTVGKNHWEIWPREIIPKIWEAYEKVILERVPVRIEDFNSSLKIWLSVDAYPTPNGGVAAFFRDVTLEKTAILNIQSQKDRFNRLAAACGIGVQYCDLPLSDLNWDEKTREHFWVTASAHITIDTFFERIHPEDREATSKAIEESMKSCSLCDVEYRTISPSNKSAIKWIRAIGWPEYDQSGMPVRFDGVTLDITEQKNIIQRLEDEKQKLEAIFENSPATMSLLRGPTFIVEKVNSNYRQLVGGRDNIGKTVFEATPEVDMRPFIDHLKKVLETGIPYCANEVVVPLIRTPGGKPEDTYLDFTYSRVKDGQGKPYGIYGHAIVTTEKVMARKQIEQLAKSLSESVRARDEFMSIASHELKTPITGMKIQTQMFKRAVRNNLPHAYEPKRVTEMVHAVDYGLDRMTRLVEDMLDISKIQLGKLEVQCEPTNITTLVAEIIERMRPEFTSAGITVHTKLTEELHCNLDRFRFEQVLTNLATNAFRYAPNAPVEIELKREASHVVLRFRDHGPGIPAVDHERVFKRFERLVSADKTSGMGLGLYICREIVETQGGSIRIDAQASPGACFIISLPIEAGLK